MSKTRNRFPPRCGPRRCGWCLSMAGVSVAPGCRGFGSPEDRLFGPHAERPGEVCRVLPVAQRSDPSRLSVRAQRDEAPMPEVMRVFTENLSVYGVRKFWRQMQREGFDLGSFDLTCSRRRIPFPKSTCEHWNCAHIIAVTSFGPMSKSPLVLHILVAHGYKDRTEI